MRYLIAALVICMFVAGGVSISSSAQEDFPDLRSIAVVIYDADLDRVLFEKNGHERRSIASLTKIMTMLLAAEMVESGQISLEETVKASANAASRGGTEIKLRAGDELTVEELLYASALASANDAAVALAEYIAGSEKAYADLMSRRAVELGLKHTNFVDSTGLLSIYHGNYSTAYETALLSKIAMQNTLFRQLVSTQEYFLEAQGRTIRNTNPLLGEVEGVEGVKTGATTPAGHTLVTSTVRRGRRLIVVILGGPSRNVRNQEMEQLIEWSFDRLTTLAAEGEHITYATVPDGVDHTISCVTAQEASVFRFHDNPGKIERRVELMKNIRAPIEKGQTVGKVTFLEGGEPILTVDLVAAEGTGLASIFRRIWFRISEWLRRVF